MIELSAKFVERIKNQLGDEAPRLFDALDGECVRAARVNLLKTPSLLPFDTTESVPWCSNGYYISSDSLAGMNPVHEAGGYYIQDPSAMLPVAVLDPKPGERILDLCASPGGKTTQIGERMKGRGLIVSNEVIPKRAVTLSRNVERMGLTNCIVTSVYPQQIMTKWQRQFDAVLVDAPCSGEGMFRKNPESRKEWSEENAAGCAERQLEILDCAAEMVAEGGRMVYSTCTLNPEENEKNVERFCDRHPEFSAESFTLPGVDGTEGMFTCFPHRIKGEGQFAALLRKKGCRCEIKKQATGFSKPSKQQLQVFSQFCNNEMAPDFALGETIVKLDEFVDLTGIKTLRAGLHLGSVKGKLFIPDHAWAVSAMPPDLPHIELTEEEAWLYIKGEVIKAPEDIAGWVLPCICGIPMGFGKISDGIVKNHYPKGLRR